MLWRQASTLKLLELLCRNAVQLCLRSWPACLVEDDDGPFGWCCCFLKIVFLWATQPHHCTMEELLDADNVQREPMLLIELLGSPGPPWVPDCKKPPRANSTPVERPSNRFSKETRFPRFSFCLNALKQHPCKKWCPFFPNIAFCSSVATQPSKLKQNQSCCRLEYRRVQTSKIQSEGQGRWSCQQVCLQFLVGPSPHEADAASLEVLCPSSTSTHPQHQKLFLAVFCTPCARAREFKQYNSKKQACETRRSRNNPSWVSCLPTNY